MKFSYPNKGFTLVELCITLAIISILTFSAAAIFPSLIQGHRADKAINEISALFRLARTEAITKGAIVTICPLNGSQQCTNQWNDPVSVFVDFDNSRSLTNTETVITQTASAPHGQIRVAPQNRRYFQFGPLGGAKGTLGNITYCSGSIAGNVYTRQLVVSFAGRIRLAKDENGDGQAEHANGRPIVCN